MVIFKMLIFTLLVFVLLPIFKLGIAIFRAYRQVKRRSEAFAGAATGRSRQNATTNGYGRRRRPNSAMRKIFRSDEGEYVRFEEVEVDIVEEQERRRRYGSTVFRTEEQVSDAEWTEIKD